MNENNEYWALYECDCLNFSMVHRSEIALKEYAVELTGEPWALCQRLFKILKVRVEPLNRGELMMSEENKRISECVANNDDLLMKAEQHIQKLTCELKEKESEKAHYLKENDFLKEALRRLIGA